MAFKIIDIGYDFRKNKIIRFVVDPLTTYERVTLGNTLDSTHEGLHVFDTTLDRPMYWTGTTWYDTDNRYYTKTEIDTTLINYGGLEQFDNFSNFPVTGNPKKLYLDKNNNNRTYYWNSTTNAYKKLNAFNSDYQISLKDNKNYMRWSSGDSVPATDMVAEEILLLGAVEPINPTALLNSSTVVQFNQTSISNVLNFSRTINSLGASVLSASLEWRRNNTGSWVVLSTSTLSGSFTHVLTDSNFNTQPFNYRYVVTDSVGASSTVTLNITPVSYVAPSINFTAPAQVLVSPETNTNRELGNTPSTLQGSTSRTSPFVDILSYKYQVSVNGGSFTDLGSSTSLSGSGGTFTNLLDIQNTVSSNVVSYKVIVTDTFTTTSSTYTFNLKAIIYFGTCSATATLDSTLIRSLQRRFFDTGNPFNLVTGTTERRFIVSLLNPSTLITAYDATNNQIITGNFILNNFNVIDAAGNNRSYNNYVYTNALPYPDSANLQITYS